MDVAALRMIEHFVAVPLQPPPLQPRNRAPVATAAVRVTVVPLTKLSEQSRPHEIPAGALATEPGPDTVMESL